MSFESDLYASLIGAAGLTALVGEEIVPSHEISGVSAREYVVYTTVHSDPRYSLTGEGNLTRVRVQIDCYSKTADGAAAIARAVIAAIPTSGWPLHRTSHSNQDAGLEEEPRLFRRLLEFSIFHRSA